MIFFGKPKKEKQRIVLDISSSQVDGALINFGAEGSCEIRKSFHSENAVLPQVDLTQLWRKIEKLTASAVSDLKPSGSRVEEAMVIFSSPWYFSETHHVFRKFDAPETIKKEFVDAAVEEESDKFKKDIFERFRISENEALVLPVRMMQTRLNGYSAAVSDMSFLGKKAEIFEMFLYFSAVFAPAAESIKRVLEENGIGKVEITTSPLVFYKSVSQIQGTNLAVVDIGGETTDVILVKGGVISDILSYGRGFNYAVRKVSSVFNVGLEEASVLIASSADRKLEASLNERVKAGLKESANEWQNLLRETIESLSLRELLPDKMILLGYASGFSEFREAANQPDLARFTALGRPFSVLNESSEDKTRFNFCLAYASE
ncbi:MAG: hypothetical protein HY446_01220 [Candidatus Niyogibacteria bacterium]|nr:hypothetical protein [Candidatus Niyogibacteria bacterium]